MLGSQKQIGTALKVPVVDINEKLCELYNHKYIYISQTEESSDTAAASKAEDVESQQEVKTEDSEKVQPAGLLRWFLFTGSFR